MLSKEALKTAIMSEFLKEGFISTEANEKLAKAVANAVIDHITAFGEVTGGTCTPSGPIKGGKIQ